MANSNQKAEVTKKTWTHKFQSRADAKRFAENNNADVHRLTSDPYFKFVVYTEDKGIYK